LGTNQKNIPFEIETETDTFEWLVNLLLLLTTLWQSEDQCLAYCAVIQISLWPWSQMHINTLMWNINF